MTGGTGQPWPPQGQGWTGLSSYQGRDRDQPASLVEDNIGQGQDWQKMGVGVDISLPQSAVTTYNTLAGHQPQFNQVMQKGHRPAPA